MQEIKESLDRYSKNKIPTGGFLRKVLENDLVGAIGKADHINRNRLYDIVSYCYNHIPEGCWGSKEAVKNWLGEE